MGVPIAIGREKGRMGSRSFAREMGDGIAKLREGDGSFSIAKKSYASNSKSNL